MTEPQRRHAASRPRRRRLAVVLVAAVVLASTASLAVPLVLLGAQDRATIECARGLGSARTAWLDDWSWRELSWRCNWSDAAERRISLLRLVG